MSGAVATLTSFQTGDASLYLSTGGGVIGGVGRATVRDAAIAFVEAATPYLKHMDLSTDFPKPAQGMVRFYVLTTRGIHTAEFTEADLGGNKLEFSPLFYAGQEVLTRLRTARADTAQ